MLCPMCGKANCGHKNLFGEANVSTKQRRNGKRNMSDMDALIWYVTDEDFRFNYPTSRALKKFLSDRFEVKRKCRE